ncbi:hypothetical protein NM208_g9611 [Fusarium decemcellulare]|uniref:Uncharacterized protein n=1 Tax=Fusarium decemcellulare TaxID=57161 RepID=A0ACC1S178_9HYPO|nr:hypothetical protein NM208_g9611 [Fusarium decemcellulare]
MGPSIAGCNDHVLDATPKEAGGFVKTPRLQPWRYGRLLNRPGASGSHACRGHALRLTNGARAVSVSLEGVTTTIQGRKAGESREHHLGPTLGARDLQLIRIMDIGEDNAWPSQVLRVMKDCASEESFRGYLAMKLVVKMWQQGPGTIE